jgi:hypothetical protein
LDFEQKNVWNAAVESIKNEKFRELDPKIQVQIGLVLWRDVLSSFQQAVADG